MMKWRARKLEKIKGEIQGEKKKYQKIIKD